MKITLCKSGDGRVAVGTGNRPVEYCRPCYVDTYGGQFQAFKVTVPEEGMAVACAKTGEDIPAGGTVWLDPAETQILGLLSAGLIEPLPDAKPGKAKPAAGA